LLDDGELDVSMTVPVGTRATFDVVGHDPERLGPGTHRRCVGFDQETASRRRAGVGRQS
jgi:hypothetical protein